MERSPLALPFPALAPVAGVRIGTLLVRLRGGFLGRPPAALDASVLYA